MVKQKKRRTVLASGTFDLLHLEHVKYLEDAKMAGGENAKLIVIVTRDSTAEKRRGEKPVISEDHRRALVEALKIVDEALLGYDEADIRKVIEKIRPDVIAIGHDQRDIERAVQKVIAEGGLSIQITRIEKFGKDEVNSSSKIKRKIIETWR
jgi:FAD synthetase